MVAFMVTSLAAMLVLSGAATPEGVRREVHVCAAVGSDANSGSSDAPLRSLLAAQNAARRLRSGAGSPTVDVVLHATGVHHLAEPLVLDGRDSHTNFVAAAAGGTVLVSGGVRVAESAVTPRPGHAGQFQANMTALGLADLGTVLPTAQGALHPQLFISQQSGMLARWPDSRNQTSWQWAYTEDCLSPSCSSNCNCSGADITGFSWRTTQTNGSGIPPAVAHGWATESDPYMHGYWLYDWLDRYLPLIGVDAARNGLLVGAAAAAAAPLSKVKTGSRYYVFNLLAELDSVCLFLLFACFRQWFRSRGWNEVAPLNRTSFCTL